MPGDVVLHQDDENIDHFIIVRDIKTFNQKATAALLAQRGLEIIPGDECMTEYTFEGVKIYLANIDGIEPEPAPTGVAA